LADLVAPHPVLEVKNEYQYKDMVPPHSVLAGFANERQCYSLTVNFGTSACWKPWQQKGSSWGKKWNLHPPD
jgi:hypothetical protein